MYRSYQSVLPCHNKLLQQRWDRTYYEEHRRKVRDVAPVVDTRAPVTYMHLHLKLKKLQLEEERLATIERDNRILLEKMAYIMRTKGRVDNLNNYDYKSLNREKRQRELLRVTRENQAILKRIMMRQAEYSQEKWQREWAHNQHLMDNISHYPPEWWLLKEAENKNRKQDKKSGRVRDSAEMKSSGRRKSGHKSLKQKAVDEDSQDEVKAEDADEVKVEETKPHKDGVKGRVEERSKESKVTEESGSKERTVSEDEVNKEK